jgi:hypothetical protein
MPLELSRPRTTHPEKVAQASGEAATVVVTVVLLELTQATLAAQLMALVALVVGEFPLRVQTVL